jgi:hypothetical protein
MRILLGLLIAVCALVVVEFGTGGQALDVSPAVVDESPTLTATLTPEAATETLPPTGTAAPTETSTPVPTDTPLPVATDTPVPTATPSPPPRETPTAVATDTTTPTAMTEPVTNIAFPVRAAFYYPWYPGNWTNNGIYPYSHYEPTLGYYDQDAADVSAHIAQMQYGKIQVGIASWWGQGHRTDQKIPLLLSQAAGTGFGNPTAVQIQADIDYLVASYGASDAVAKIDGRIVIFVYNADDSTCEVVDRWRQANTANAYLVMKAFSGYRSCANQPDGWHQYAPATRADQQGSSSYSISPGFYHALEPDPRLARDPAAWALNVQAMVASGANWQLITTFNEWGEGTGVESTTSWQTDSGFGIYLDVLQADGQIVLPPTTTPTVTGTPVPTATGTLVPSATSTQTPVLTPTGTPVPTATVPAGSRVFTPAADARVEQASPNANFGTATTLIADTSPLTESYLRFNLTGLTGAVQSATLRLWVVNETGNGPPVSSCGGATWSDTDLTWNTRPTRARLPRESGSSMT